MKISLKDIIKIQYLEMEIFQEEDDFSVDNRIVINKERAIYNILENITEDRERQKEIRYIIYENMWNTEDNTFKPICNALRNLGYEVVR